MGNLEAPKLHFVPAGALGALHLAVWEWPGQEPPLFFAHATGFHGRCWDHIVRLFPGRRALAAEVKALREIVQEVERASAPAAPATPRTSPAAP